MSILGSASYYSPSEVLYVCAEVGCYIIGYYIDVLTLLYKERKKEKRKER